MGHSRKCLIVFLFSVRDHIPVLLSFTATSAHETQHRVSNPNKQRVPGGPCYNARLFSASPCKGVAAAWEEGMCWSTGWQPAGSPPPRTDVTSPGHSSTGWPGSLPLSLLIPPSPYKTSRWLAVTPGEGRRHGIGDWYQLFQRKICHTQRV